MKNDLRITGFPLFPVTATPVAPSHALAARSAEALGFPSVETEIVPGTSTKAFQKTLGPNDNVQRHFDVGQPAGDPSARRRSFQALQG